MAFLSDTGKAALSEAISAVEDRSIAELVVIVRPSSGDYRANDLLVGFVVALASAAFMLFAPPEFGLMLILLGPAVVVAIVVSLLRALPGLRALFVGEARQRDAVLQAAQACFFAKGIANTQGRTGVLIFASVFERRVVVLADSGVLAAIDEPTWTQACRAIERILEDEGDALVLAERITALAPLLAAACPRGEHDVDELANEVEG
ncbi:hypothetical protein ACNOYE_35265 [Nannocystaceae bacterium ST9]